MSLRLLFFAFIYSLITLYLWNQMNVDQSASLGYVFIFFWFWIIAGILLGLMMWFSKIKIVRWNIIIFIFCTPIPSIMFVNINNRDNVKSTYEHTNSAHRIREVEYKNRKEYFTSVDSISELNPYPATENYKLDSIAYVDENGKVLRKEFSKSK